MKNIHGNYKLTLEQSEEIRSKFKKGISRTELARKYKVSYNTITRIVIDENYIQSKPSKRDGEMNYNAVFSWHDVIEIKKSIKKGVKVALLAKKYNCTRGSIYGIKTGRTYSWV